jgi:hypothetical protein
MVSLAVLFYMFVFIFARGAIMVGQGSQRLQCFLALFILTVMRHLSTVNTSTTARSNLK